MSKPFRAKGTDSPGSLPFPEVNYDLDDLRTNHSDPPPPTPEQDWPPAMGVILILGGASLFWLAIGLAAGFVVFAQ